MHLAGMGVFSVIYGLLRAVFLFTVCVCFFDLSVPDAEFFAALVVLAISSVSFLGIGMMTSVLPLISPEKGTQLGWIAQGTLLVVSGVYYPVEVLPNWMEWLAKISPATYALDGARDAILDGQGLIDDVGRDLAAAHHRRRLGPARPLDLLPGRAVREEAREAEEIGMRTADTAAAKRPPSGMFARSGSALADPDLAQRSG